MSFQTKILRLLACLLLVALFGPFSHIKGAGISSFSLTIQPSPQCDDGGDNDGDGSIDYPDDSGCSSSSDDSEVSVSGGGGGGGGGGGIINPIVTSITFSGRAYPNSSVTILKDAQVAISTTAGSDAQFLSSISGLSGGNYMFSAYSEDGAGHRSSLLTFPVSVTAGTATTVSGIFIAPTISTDKSQVKKGDSIAILGQSVPNSEIVITVNSEQEFFGKVAADANGAYLYNFDTSILDYGEHSTKSKASLNQTISGYSYSVGFMVGTKNLVSEADPGKADINNDARVNLIDFSIAAYWYRKASPPASVDLNSDGIVNLSDFSIMAYFWTG